MFVFWTVIFVFKVLEIKLDHAGPCAHTELELRMLLGYVLYTLGFSVSRFTVSLTHLYDKAQLRVFLKLDVPFPVFKSQSPEIKCHLLRKPSLISLQYPLLNFKRALSIAFMIMKFISYDFNSQLFTLLSHVAYVFLKIKDHILCILLFPVALMKTFVHGHFIIYLQIQMCTTSEPHTIMGLRINTCVSN